MAENYLPHDHKKPQFFYGHIIVICAFVIMLFTFGINYSFSIFFTPLLIEFGWTRAGTSGIYSLMTLVAGFLGIFAGRLTDLFGPRILGIASGCFLGLGFLLMSQSNAIWQIYLIYGVVIAAGIGGCWPILVPTVVRWFKKRRGIMTGIVVSGTGAGTMLIPLFATMLISLYDWRLTYIIIGIITLILIITSSLFLKSDPHKSNDIPYGEGKITGSIPETALGGYTLIEAIHTRNFAILCLIFFCFGFALHSVMVHIAKHALETQISATGAAGIIVVIGALNAIGRIIMAGVSDKFGVKITLVTCFVLLALSLLWLQVSKELWMFYIFAIFFGIAYGGIITFMALTTAELFGVTSLGVIMGVVTFSYTIGGAAGPSITGLIYDIYGSYKISFLTLFIITIIACFLCALLKFGLPLETIRRAT